jgi:quinol monooxygenase YgiN
MLIVAGHFEVDPADQAAFVASKVDAMKRTRAEAGCLEYAMTADPLDPTRVLLFERWADQASFDAHMAGLATAPKSDGPAPKGFTVSIFDVAAERPFG